MPDPTTTEPTAGLVPAAPAQGHDSVEAMRVMLETVLDRLAGGDAVTDPSGRKITDMDGREYLLPRAIPASRQIQLLRHVRVLLGLPASASVSEAFRSGQLATGIGGLLEVLAEPKAAEAVNAAFMSALPGIWSTAQASYADLPEGERPEGPLDAFPLEEVAQALLPFCRRMLIGTIRAAFGPGSKATPSP